MEIHGLVELLDLEIEVTFAANRAGPWICRLIKPGGKVFFKEYDSDIMERSCSGWGKTPSLAVHNFLVNLSEDKIQKICIVDSKGARSVFNVPSNLYTKL